MANAALERLGAPGFRGPKLGACRVRNVVISAAGLITCWQGAKHQGGWSRVPSWTESLRYISSRGTSSLRGLPDHESN
eukprot:1160168-Pelagomonas_calceolata.AAC.7